MQWKPTPVAAAFLFGVGSLVMLPGAAFAQSSSSSEAQRSTGAAATGEAVSESELGAFVDAYVEVKDIQRELSTQISRTDNPKPDEMRRIQSDGEKRAVSAISKAGLTPNRYNEILAQVNTDPELRSRTLAMIQKERRGS